MGWLGLGAQLSCCSGKLRHMAARLPRKPTFNALSVQHRIKHTQRGCDLLPGVCKRFAPKASESRTVDLWVLPQQYKPCKLQLSSMCKSSLFVAVCRVVTDSSDGATLGSKCWWKGKKEGRAGPGPLVLYRRKEGPVERLILRALNKGAAEGG